MVTHLFIIVAAILVIWFCSGRILDITNLLAGKLRLPALSFSLLLLGMLTSIPEASVALNAVLIAKPEVSLGNLIGGQVILLFVIIPLLAFRKKGLRFHYPLQPRTFAVIVITNALPLYALLNRMATTLEAVMMLLCYLLFTAIFLTDLEQEHQTLHQRQGRRTTVVRPVGRGFLVLLGCIGLIFFASNRLITEVVYIANYFSLHPFVVSLFVIALGTNIPELTLTVRAIFSGRTEIALGNYIGSATTNTLIAAVVILASNGVRISMPTTPLLIPIAGSGIFWWFARSKRTLSAGEASLLILVALSFFALMTWLELAHFLS